MHIDATLPRSRTEQLVIQHTPDETLVYDLERHKAHCLNKTASAIWTRCDGQTSVPDMARMLHEELGVPIDESIVWMGLGQLRKARLLDVQVSLPSIAIGSRRDAIKRIGLVGGSAALLPIIASIVAPTAVSAATCKTSGTACGASIECCSGLCVGVPSGVCT